MRNSPRLLFLSNIIILSETKQFHVHCMCAGALVKRTFCFIGRTKSLQAQLTHKLPACLSSACHTPMLSGYVSWYVTVTILNSIHTLILHILHAGFFSSFPRWCNCYSLKTICRSLSLWCCRADWWLFPIISGNGSFFYPKVHPGH